MFCLILRIFLIYRRRLESDRPSALNHPRDLIYRTDLEVCLSVFIISLLLCWATVSSWVFIMRATQLQPAPLELNSHPVAASSHLSPHRTLHYFNIKSPSELSRYNLTIKVVKQPPEWNYSSSNLSWSENLVDEMKFNDLSQLHLHKVHSEILESGMSNNNSSQ